MDLLFLRINLKIHKVDVLAGGDAAPEDKITADGQRGVSFIHPMGEIFLPPLAGETDTLTCGKAGHQGALEQQKAGAKP